MAYGDKITIKRTVHLEGKNGEALCGSGYYGGSDDTCINCQNIYEANEEQLSRWNEGAGLDGSNNVQDDPDIFVERKPYTPGTAWN